MKKNILLITALLSFQQLKAQMIVSDPTEHSLMQVFQNENQQLSILQHSEQMSKWLESIQTLNNQLNELKQQVQLAKQVVTYVGDPAQAAQDMIISPILGETGIGQTLSELQTAADGAQALAYDGQGLFQSIQELHPDVNFDANSLDFKKYAAVQKAEDNYQIVVDTNEEKIQAIRTQLKEALEKAKSATDQSTVQKIQAQITTLSTELESLQAEKEDALQHIHAQQIANENQKSLENEANSEAAAQELQQTGQAIRDFTKTLTVETPQFEK